MDDILSDLFRHMEWADARVWTAVLSSENAQDDDALKVRLLHIHNVQRGFLSVWKREPPVFPDPGAFSSATALGEYGREYHQAATTFVAQASESALSEIVTLPWASKLAQVLGRTPAATTLRDTIVQVAMHTTYHRGQVNLRLRELGVDPPQVDFIAWIWLDRPSAQWP